MTETNHAREAAASSPSPYLSDGMLRAQANPCCAFPDAVQVLSREVLRLRAQCPPTAEVEKMRAELATANDDVKRLRDEKRDQIAATVEHLRRAGIIVGSPTAGPTPGVAIGEPMTLASTIGMLCDDRAKILAGLGREAKALLEASFMLRCAEGGRPLPAPRVEETFGIFEALRKVIAERGALAFDRDAWKHKANTLGGDLNRIRSIVPTASDEQTTFDAVQAYLAKVHKERDASSKALFDVAIALEEADGGRSGTYENGQPRIRALATARDVAQRDATELRLAVDTLRTQNAKLRGALIECGRATGAAITEGVSDDFLSWVPSEVERVVARLRAKAEPVAAALLAGADAATVLDHLILAGLPAEAQTAIAAMRDVGPELAKAGIQVGPRCSHAEAIAQLRGERDRWREKFEAADKEAADAARWGINTAGQLRAAGFSMPAPMEAGIHGAVLDALTELARLRKESKRDQVGKQQALLDEIARLVPGKGPLLERVRAAAKPAPSPWRERFMRLRDGIKAQIAWRSLPGGAPFAGMHKEHAVLSCALGNADAMLVEAAGDGGASWASGLSLFERRSCKAGGVVDAPNIEPSRPSTAADFLDAMCKTEPKPEVARKPVRDLVEEALRMVRGKQLPKVDGEVDGLPPVDRLGRVHVGPNFSGLVATVDADGKLAAATGQPRTEAPLAADGRGTVVELGDEFREELWQAAPSTIVLDTMFGESTEAAKLRHLHAAVAELAKVVERMGAR